jgi:hypothetical protein
VGGVKVMVIGVLLAYLGSADNALGFLISCWLAG